MRLLKSLELMRINVHKTWIFGLIVIAAGCAPRAAHAQMPPLGVGPLEVDVRAPRPGARLSGAFNVFNGGTEPMHISAYLSDWTMSSDGQIQFDKPGTSPLSCAPWIELNPKSFVLPGNGKTIVRYTINTPVEMATQHNTLVFFESRPMPLKERGSQKITVAARMGAKVLVSPAQPLPEHANLSGILAGTSLGEEPAIAFNNTGKRAVRVKGTVEALNSDGVVVGKAELSPANVQILAGSSVKLRPQWASRPSAGIYTLRVIADYGVKTLLGAEAKVELTAPAPPEPVAPLEVPVENNQKTTEKVPTAPLPIAPTLTTAPMQSQGSSQR